MRAPGLVCAIYHFCAADMAPLVTVFNQDPTQPQRDSRPAALSGVVVGVDGRGDITTRLEDTSGNVFDVCFPAVSVPPAQRAAVTVGAQLVWRPPGAGDDGHDAGRASDLTITGGESLAEEDIAAALHRAAHCRNPRA